MFVFILFPFTTFAQEEEADTTLQIVEIEEELVLDTVFSDRKFLDRGASEITYTKGINGIKIFRPDTTLDYFHIYDPARQKDFRFLNTGNIGSAAHYIFFDNYTPFGFRTGHEQFDVYRFTKDNIPFYNSRVSYSNLKIMIGTNREQLYEATHNQNIGSQFNFGFNFRRVASTGLYTNQETGNNSAALTARVNSKNKRYTAQTILQLNNMKSLENGGVEFTGMFDDTTFTTKTLLEVNSPNARTEDREMGALVRQSYSFGKKAYESINDTTVLYEFYPSITFYHEAEYKRRKYRFYDTNPDSLFYDDFYSISDSIENQYIFKDLRNEFGVNFSRIKCIDTTGSPQYNDFLIRASATYAYLEWFNQFHFESLSELNVNFSVSDHPNVEGRFLYAGNLRMALASYNQGDLRANAYLGLQGDKWGQLKVLSGYSRQEPAYVAQRFFIRDFSWQNDFQKENYFWLGADYILPKHRLGLSGRMFTLSNLIYYDSDRRPAQSDNAQNVFTASLDHSLRVGWFGLDNLLRVQYLTQDDALRVPLFWMRSSIYAQGRIFKKVMLGKVGFDMYYNTPYDALYYFPMTGQFQLNGNNTLNYVPRLDLFLSFQVKSLSIFAKMQNLLQGIGEQNGNFNFYRYPEYDRAFKVGLSWDFYN
ncbi:MAG: putative porin [Chitinophagales bacterium]